MLILSIDTSTTVCSVALHKDGQLLACYELFAEKSSSGMLTTLIQNGVQHTGHGSYTGLRIGVSTAKGLCYALDKPMIAVNTLEAMARQISGQWRVVGGHSTHQSINPSTHPTLFCPMLDARRMEVYAAVYDADGREVMPTTAVIVDEHSFAEVLAEQPVLFFGNGAAKCEPVLGQHPNARFLNALIQPSARTVGELAARAYAEGRFEDVAAFEPFYLKDFMGTKPKKAVV